MRVWNKKKKRFVPAGNQVAGWSVGAGHDPCGRHADGVFLRVIRVLLVNPISPYSTD